MILDKAENKFQSPSVAVVMGKTQGIAIEQLIGELRLNLTQPECSHGRRNT